VAISVNADPYIRNACNFNLVFNVFDRNSFIPWINTNTGSTGQYNSLFNCGGTRKWNFEYTNDSAGRNKAKEFLRQIPDKSYVVFRNFSVYLVSGNQYVSDWINDRTVYGNGNTLYDELTSRGITVINSFTRPRAMSAVYKKGDTGFIPAQIISDSTTDVTSLSVNCKTPDSTGTVTSPLYGPTKAWRQLKWRGASDNIKHTVY
jgi:hypothetical protein